VEIANYDHRLQPLLLIDLLTFLSNVWHPWQYRVYNLAKPINAWFESNKEPVETKITIIILFGV
jgi:hypothetical protein